MRCTPHGESAEINGHLLTGRVLAQSGKDFSFTWKDPSHFLQHRREMLNNATHV